MNNKKPDMNRSWAEALGAPTPSGPKLAPWATPAVNGDGAEETETVAAPEEPVSFDVAIQSALERLQVTAPANEMKKRCVLPQACAIVIWSLTNA